MNPKSMTLQSKSTNAVIPVILLSLSLGLAAHLSFKFPFMPVPWVLQNHLAILIGYRFGAKVGFFSVLFFLVQGLLGAPVFAGGNFGPSALLGPTGGYLLAYPLAAYFSGWLKERMPSESSYSMLGNFMLSHAVIYACGVTQLSLFIGLKSALMLGALPFIATEVLKSVLTIYAFRKKA